MEKNSGNNNAKNSKEDDEIAATQSLEQLKKEVNYLKEQLIESKTLLEEADNKIKHLYIKSNEFEIYLQQSNKYLSLINKYKKLRTRLDDKKIAKYINKFKYFDVEYYLNNNQDIKLSKVTLINHYIEHGAKERRNPNERFDTNYYVTQNLDVKECNINPLYHYIRYGFFEGRRPSKEADMYLEWCQFNSNRKSIIEMVKQFKSGYYIYKSGLFDGQWYLLQNIDVADNLIKSPLWNLRFSKIKLLRFVGRLTTSAIIHYIRHGVYEGRNPNPNFSNSFYINDNLDLLKEKNLNPFTHYIKFGIKENRKANYVENLSDISKFYDYTYRHMEIDQKLEEKISIIVGPGKEVAEINKRLQSVYMQDYVNVEIIVIDLNNDSVITEIINKYYNLHKENTKVIKINSKEKTNYSIWQQAINKATSKLVWLVKERSICESNFISKLMPYFLDESIMLAYCPTKYIDGNEVGIKKYLGDKGDYINTAFMEINGIKNYSEPIYEMSSTIFRKPQQLQWYLNDKWELEYEQVFTDFIINIIAGGKLAGISDILHKREIEKENIKYNSNLLCIQHQKLLLNLKKLYNIKSDIMKENYEYIRTCYLSNSNKTIDHFTGIYNIEEVMQCEAMPNIVISIASFTQGGGEIMPIRLANQLKEMGYPVIVHNYKLEDTQEQVRLMLNPSIPVFQTNNVDEMKIMLKMFDIRVISTHHQALQSFVAKTLKNDVDLAAKINHVATSHGMYENFTEEILNMIFETIGSGVDYWTYVADKNIVPFKEHNIYNSEQFIKIPNGMKLPQIKAISKQSLGINESSFTICTVSRAIPEKGWEQAIQSVKLARQLSNIDMHLILIGNGTIYDKLIAEGVEDFVHLLGFKDNPCDYYAISDLCLLTSYYKSESAPLTIIEAILSQIPVIASNIGDIKQMLSVDGEIAGEIFDLDNWTVPIETVAKKIVNLAKDKERYAYIKDLVLEKGKEFDIKAIAEQYIDVFMKKNNIEIAKEDIIDTYLDEINNANLLLSNADRKTNSLKVSVIVPNYNHEKYLRTRLDCIYNQTYKNIEVILMDDCSKDESRKILNEYAEKYPDVTKVIFNETNSGGVFHQWKKGVESATGDICWIAESDDYCDTNFLEKLVPAFSDPNVKISYCKYIFVNSKGESNTEGFLRYVGEIDDEKWRTSYINDTDNEVEQFLSIKNTIPNASGAIFRKPKELKLFQDKDWMSMKICGDWIFYLHIAYGGKIAYSVETQSYFRFHDNNSSADTYTRPTYYKEHEAVAYTLRELYAVSEESLTKNYEIIKKFYLRNVKGDEMNFNKLYDLKKIFSKKRIEEKPSIRVVEKEDSNIITSEKANKHLETVLINPIFSAGKNLDSNIEEKVRYTGNNTGNLLFVESMKEQLNYVKETWLRPSELNNLGNISAVMPSSNFIIHGGDAFIEQCAELLNNTTCPITLAGLGAQSTKELNTPKKLVNVLTKTKINYFKSIAERATTLGVRGEFTAQCLEEMGIHNYRIIGCPSAFKYLDGIYKTLDKANSKKVMFTVTTGSEHERKLLEMGIKSNGKWIMQMMTEFPETAYEGKELNEKWMQIRFPGIQMSKEELKKYMEENAKMFFRINDWYDYYKSEEFTFAFGSRFHGNMSALRSGIPALWIVHDSRTTELVNTLKLPNIDFAKFEKAKNVEDLIEMCNYDEFYKNYRRLAEEYVKFLDENNLNHKFTL